MELKVKMYTELPDSHGDVIPDWVVKAGTPVRLNFENMPIGEVVSDDGDGNVTIRIDNEDSKALVERLLDYYNVPVTRIYPTVKMETNGDFKVIECSITPRSFGSIKAKK